mmetsp:Transcript_56628/g.123259  ORF Transcript_56628/g.123259 Transcript_56628/m.123259 type:complete len:498 (+) Transcript_56628:2890-4383(+)
MPQDLQEKSSTRLALASLEVLVLQHHGEVRAVAGRVGAVGAVRAVRAVLDWLGTDWQGRDLQSEGGRVARNLCVAPHSAGLVALHGHLVRAVLHAPLVNGCVVGAVAAVVHGVAEAGAVAHVGAVHPRHAEVAEVGRARLAADGGVRIKLLVDGDVHPGRVDADQHPHLLHGRVRGVRQVARLVRGVQGEGLGGDMELGAGRQIRPVEVREREVHQPRRLQAVAPLHEVPSRVLVLKGLVGRVGLELLRDRRRHFEGPVGHPARLELRGQVEDRAGRAVGTVGAVRAVRVVRAVRAVRAIRAIRAVRAVRVVRVVRRVLHDGQLREEHPFLHPRRVHWRHRRPRRRLDDVALLSGAVGDLLRPLDRSVLEVLADDDLGEAHRDLLVGDEAGWSTQLDHVAGLNRVEELHREPQRADHGAAVALLRLLHLHRRALGDLVARHVRVVEGVAERRDRVALAGGWLPQEGLEHPVPRGQLEGVDNVRVVDRDPHGVRQPCL